MSNKQTIVIPELGDFESVPVIEILVAEGDHVDAESPLITLESDKATMDVPSSHAGRVEKILVSIGQEVNSGDPVAELSLSGEQPDTVSGDEPGVADTAEEPAAAAAPP